MAFHFTLEAPLRIAQMKQRCAERDVQCIHGMITQQRQTIESLRQMQAELSSVIATKMAVQVSAAELKFQTAERRALQLRERTANHCAAELLQRLESQQRVLLTIRREREMLEQLHARCRRDYDRIVERKTQANLDELFLYRRR